MDDAWANARAAARLVVAGTLDETVLLTGESQRIAGLGRLNRFLLFEAIAESGPQPAERTVIEAVGSAIEAVHRASVIRDDIQDMDTLRRGVQCEHIRSSIPDALALADLLLGVGMDSIAAAHPTLSIPLIHTIAEMADGQYLDIVGGFLSAGIVSRRSTEDCSLLSQIGRQLGTAFQLQNDINNTVTDEGRGQPVGSDLLHDRLSSVAILNIRRSGTVMVDPQTLASTIGEVRSMITELLDSAVALSADLADELPLRLKDLIFDTDEARRFISDQAPRA